MFLLAIVTSVRCRPMGFGRTGAVGLDATVEKPLIKPMAIHSELTDKQQAFRDHYVEHRNANEAYRHAYDAVRMSGNSVAKAAYELMRLPHVRASSDAGLEQQRQAAIAGLDFTVRDALVRLIETAAADPNELIGLRVGCCRFCHGDNHRYQWREREYLEACDAVEKRNAHPKRTGEEEPLPDPAGGFDYDHTRAPHDECPECRGEGVERIVARDTTKLSRGARMLYRGVKQTRNGIEVVLADQDKALQDAIRILGGFTDTVDVRLRAAIATAPMATIEEAVNVYDDLIKAGASVDSIVKGR